MFAKIFRQIFDSSIANNYRVRRMFQDLLILADQDGVVDMTYDSIARRTGVPLDEVVWAIGKLMEPDPADRSGKKNGARLGFIDPGRDWGWRIINYIPYRELRDEESRRRYRRGYMREYMRQKRKRKVVSPVNSAELATPKIATQHHTTPHALLTNVNSADFPLKNVSPCKPLLIHVNPRQRQRQKQNKSTEIPPTVPHRGTEDDVFDGLDVSEAKQGLSDLFGRLRAAWSEEEQKLFEKRMPVSRIDLWLLRWAYLLDRNEEGWAMVDGNRLSKPKHNLIALLREFPSEVDKWRASRKQLCLSPTFIRETPARVNKEEPPGWREYFQREYGSWVPLPNSFWELDSDLRAKYQALESATRKEPPEWRDVVELAQ